MSFDHRDIRRKMDVYTLDGGYLGNVLRVESSAPNASPHYSAHIETEPVTRVSGELLGPMPTQTLGNSGPLNQVEERGYASWPDGASSLGSAVLLVGKWWGLLDRRSIPLDLVLNVSMERVILRVTLSQLTDLDPASGSART